MLAMAISGRIGFSVFRCYSGFIGALSPQTHGLYTHRRVSGKIENHVVKHRNLHCTAHLLTKPERKLKRPIDDVYLEDLYDPEVYDLQKALTTLKRYMELDFEDKDSPVRLILNLHLAPKGRGKFQSFWQISEPVHKFNYTNKVCVFTDDADSIKQCLEYGAFYAGGHDIIQKVLYGKERCDAYVATPAYFKANLQANTEMAKTIGKLVPTRKRGLSDDLIGELLRLRDGMLAHNQNAENLKCSVIVGLIEQPANDIRENILQAIELVRNEQNPKHPPIIQSAAINCCDENLTFELPEEDD